ncbi:tyrosine-type recombinase/integrase [Vampirovibrio sp.]|uniref:tyrosine-type recombinase/integrase n=1 Tax=Vampirovibrio sp. TaxID=2717857 RepID=UPI0035943BD6
MPKLRNVTLPQDYKESGGVFVCEDSQLKSGISAKKTQTSTKVQHVSGLLSVSQVSKKLGVSSTTVRRWCESGKLPAMAKPYGKKISWFISPLALEMLTREQKSELETKKTNSIQPHREYMAQWVQAMATGTLNGKIYTKRSIEEYVRYVRVYLMNHAMVSASGLKAELMSIPASMFAKREKYYKGVLCFAQFLVHSDYLEPEFLDSIKPLFPKRHLPPKRTVVDEAGVESLFSSCNTAQERLITLLLAHTGLRASEACALVWGDIDIEKGFILVRLGKGNKTRKVGISSRLMGVLQAQRQAVCHVGTSPVLLDKHGKAMHRSGLLQRLKRLGRVAGVSVSPHALRRAFVTINANKGRPLVILQRSCGHSDIKTTMSYCRTKEQEVINAMRGWD